MAVCLYITHGSNGNRIVDAGVIDQTNNTIAQWPLATTIPPVTQATCTWGVDTATASNISTAGTCSVGITAFPIYPGQQFTIQSIVDFPGDELISRPFFTVLHIPTGPNAVDQQQPQQLIPLPTTLLA